MSLTADLNIDRSPESCEKFKLAHGGAGNVTPALAFTNDERRAFLGTYFYTSMLSTSFKKLSALKWSPWMVECTSSLESEAEYETDAFLVAAVRIQHLTEEVANIEKFDAPVRFLANSFQADLDAIPSPPLSGTPKILTQLQKANAHIAIWTHSLTGLSENKPKESSELRQRIDAVWRCVEAVRIYFEIYFATPPQDFLIFPFQVFGQSVQASVTLLRLATLEVDGWDLAALREELSYSAIIGELTRRFELVETLPIDGITINNDSFTKFAAKTRWMKNLYDAKYPAHNNNDCSPAAQPLTSAMNVADGGRRWPDGLHQDMQQQQQQQQQRAQQNQQVQSGATATTTTTAAGSVVPPPQQPTPSSDEWAATFTDPQNLFTYFDDSFLNSFNFDNFDYGALPDVQMT
jgi:hypothetical protein